MHESEFIDWAVKALLAAAFATWAAVLKYFGGRHISSMDEIKDQIAALDKRLAVFEARLDVKFHDKSSNDEE